MAESRLVRRRATNHYLEGKIQKNVLIILACYSSSPFKLMFKSHRRTVNLCVCVVPQREVRFWFATGGAGFCLSRRLAEKMVPWARYSDKAACKCVYFVIIKCPDRKGGSKL